MATNKSTPTKTESSNVAETNIAPTSKTSTSTVVDGLPNLTETTSGSPAAMPLENGEPSSNGGLVSQDENASRTENVNDQTGNGAAADAQSQGAPANPGEADGGLAGDGSGTPEKTVKGGEVRIAAGVHKGRSVSDDGTINMNSKTEREKRVAAQNREAKESGEGEKVEEKAAA